MSAKKVISLILILTLSLLFVVGCNSNSTELQPNQTTNSDETTLVNEDDQQDVDKTKIVFSTGMPDQAWKNALEQFIKTANEKLTDVEIVAEYYPSEEEMWKVLPAQIVSGAAPDIVGLNNEGVLELIVNGTFTPLDDLVKEVGYDLNSLDDSNVNGWRYEDKLYSLPLTTTISALAVNMTMLKEAGIEKAPETMEELVVAAKAVTDKDAGKYGICINLHEFHISQYVHAFGGGWNYGDDLNSDGNEQGLNFIVDLFNKEGVAATPAQLGVNGDTDAFADGKVAMTTGGPWYIPTLKDKNVDFEWTLVPIPSGTVQRSTAYGWGLCILDSTENKTAAMKAVQAMLSQDNYEYLVEERGDIPALNSLVPRYEELYPEMAVVLDTIDDATAFNYPVSANRFKSDLVTGLESIIFQKNQTVTELLETMNSDGYKG